MTSTEEKEVQLSFNVNEILTASHLMLIFSHLGLLSDDIQNCKMVCTRWKSIISMCGGDKKLQSLKDLHPVNELENQSVWLQVKQKQQLQQNVEYSWFGRLKSKFFMSRKNPQDYPSFQTNGPSPYYDASAENSMDDSENDQHNTKTNFWSLSVSIPSFMNRKNRDKNNDDPRQPLLKSDGESNDSTSPLNHQTFPGHIPYSHSNSQHSVDLEHSASFKRMHQQFEKEKNNIKNSSRHHGRHKKSKSKNSKIKQMKKFSISDGHEGGADDSSYSTSFSMSPVLRNGGSSIPAHFTGPRDIKNIFSTSPDIYSSKSSRQRQQVVAQQQHRLGSRTITVGDSNQGHGQRLLSSSLKKAWWRLDQKKIDDMVQAGASPLISRHAKVVSNVQHLKTKAIEDLKNDNDSDEDECIILDAVNPHETETIVTMDFDKGSSSDFLLDGTTGSSFSPLQLRTGKQFLKKINKRIQKKNKRQQQRRRKQKKIFPPPSVRKQQKPKPPSPTINEKEKSQIEKLDDNITDERYTKILRKNFIPISCKSNRIQNTETLNFWKNIIIPNWSNLKTSPLVSYFWKCDGLPSIVRGEIWKKKLGNDAGLTPEHFYQHRAETNTKSNGHKRRNSIERDLNRMYTETRHGYSNFSTPNLDTVVLDTKDTICANMKLHQEIAEVLEAFCNCCPETSYVQGMTYIVQMLLQYMKPVDAFICLGNIIRYGFMASYTCMDTRQIRRRIKLFMHLLNENFPNVASFLLEIGIIPDVFLIEWVLTIFVRQLPKHFASRVWDGYFLEGEIYIWKTAVAVFYFLQQDYNFLELELDECIKILRDLPEPKITPEKFVQVISNIRVPHRVERWIEQFQPGQKCSLDTVTAAFGSRGSTPPFKYRKDATGTSFAAGGELNLKKQHSSRSNVVNVMTKRRTPTTTTD